MIADSFPDGTKAVGIVMRHRAEMNHLPGIPASIRLLISGGDVLRGHHVNNLLEKAEVYNTYGPSETTVCASYYRCRDGQVLSDVTYPIGHPDWEAISKNNENYYKEELFKDSHTACFAVNEESGEIIGCGGICYQKEMPSPDNMTGMNGYLMNIYTLPEYRGHGIGRKIIEFLIADAKARGTEKIYLESSVGANVFCKPFL